MIDAAVCLTGVDRWMWAGREPRHGPGDRSARRYVSASEAKPVERGFAQDLLHRSCNKSLPELLAAGGAHDFRQSAAPCESIDAGPPCGSYGGARARSNVPCRLILEIDPQKITCAPLTHT